MAKMELQRLKLCDNKQEDGSIMSGSAKLGGEDIYAWLDGDMQIVSAIEGFTNEFPRQVWLAGSGTFRGWQAAFEDFYERRSHDNL